MTIGTARLRSQRLVGRRFAGPADVVRWFGAVQGQEFGPAKWGVAQRMTRTTDAALNRAFDAGRILRTHMLRPTWHLVAPEDIRWMLALTSPRVQAQNAAQYRRLELDAKSRARAIDIIAGALRGRTYLTRQELRAALERRRVDASGQRLAYFVMNAELEGIICSGPLRQKTCTYALMDERVPPSKAVPRDEALAMLALRYFTSHGPAQAKDFAWWSSLPLADIRSAIGSLGSALRAETVDGATFYWLRSVSRAVIAPPVMHLLPIYDEHVVAYRDHGPSLDGRIRLDAKTAPHVFFRHFVLRNGLIVGGWTSQVRRADAVVKVTLMAPLTEDEKAAVASEAERFGRFLNLPVRLSLSRA